MTSNTSGNTGVSSDLNIRLTCQLIVGNITDYRIAPRVVKQYLDRRMALKLEPLGMQGSHGQYLLAIYFNPGASMKEIAAYLMVDKSITTRTVGVLIDTGFVRNDSRDSRRYRLMITEEGERAVGVIEGALNDIWDELLCGLTDDEVNVFKSACAKVNAKFSEEDE